MKFLARKRGKFEEFFTSKEHLIYPKKCTKNLQKLFSQKSAIFLVKGTQFLTPETIFIAFLCIKFFSGSKFVHFLLFFLIFFFFCKFYPKIGLFCSFKKEHKIFSRCHKTLKVAPMCSKAHGFDHPGHSKAVGVARN